MAEKDDNVEELLESLGKPKVTVTQGPAKGVTLEPANRRRQGVITSLGATPESTKLKKKMLLGKKKKEVKLPEHIKKVTIVINDKKPNDPISVDFAGDWAVSDLNLAGKHLILEFNMYSRNRAIRK